MTKKRRVIAIDFDGTICTNEYPYIGDPNPDIINRAIFEQKRLGACLVLWTCRTGQLLDNAILACAMWGLEFDYINETPPFRIAEYHGDDPRKISADEYWDDRAVAVKDGHFRGR